VAFAAQGAGFLYGFYQGRPGENLRAALGTGCQDDPDSSDIVICSATGVTKLRFDMGDGNDRFTWNEGPHGPPAAEVIVGGPGNDVLSGHFRSQRSVVAGGPGDDNIGDATVARGGDGKDLIRGRYGSASTIYGQGGADVLRGGGSIREGRAPAIHEGRMRVFGGPGNDTVQGSIFNDLVNGGPGNDSVTGLQGRDTLVGGSGRDGFVSDERAAGRPLRRARDKVSCGAGRDSVIADRLDRLDGCEKVRRQG
jgi:Ca2+-binding RTX toxin-like protein